MTRVKVVAYATLSWVPHAIAYAALPIAVGYVGERLGWHRRVGWWSLAGFPLIAAGWSFIVWAIAGHYRASPDEVHAVVRPNYLATGGAYALSRNPLYLGGAVMWTGWAIAFMSPAIVIVGLGLFSFLAFVGVPYEERMLRSRLGAEYDEYRRSVHRWFGRRRG